MNKSQRPGIQPVFTHINESETRSSPFVLLKWADFVLYEKASLFSAVCMLFFYLLCGIMQNIDDKFH